MKQGTIVRNKLWNGKMNDYPVYFPIDFYNQKEILKGLNHFDLMNVKVNLRFGKTDKGFDAYIISFP